MTDLDDVSMWPALSRELDGTFGLLTTADRLLRDFRHFSIEVEPFFACFAPGAERLLKVVHGLATHADTGHWPSKDQMSRELSHAITTLDSICRNHIRDGMARAVHPGYVEQLLAKAESHSVLPMLLEATNEYARGGRFHNLDTLADSKPTVASPLELWERMERHAMDERPELYPLLGLPGGFEQSLDEFKRTVRLALYDWWVLYVYAGIQGCFGATGRRWLSNRLPEAPRV